MIEYLDQTLRRLLVDRIAMLIDDDHVRFQPPDKDWRGYVGNLDGLALNLYLLDLRENRVLHSNQRVRSMVDGVAVERPAPRRIDCHYLISAWSPVPATTALEPTGDEHALLYEATRVLMSAGPLVPRQVFAPAGLPQQFPDEIADAELPIEVLPPEGFAKMAEFWGTMGPGTPWRPALFLRVTLPVVLDARAAGHLVTTLETHGSSALGVSAPWIQIGGRVLDGTNPGPDGVLPPIAGVWVELQSQAGKRLRLVQSDQDGRFTFRRLLPGTYQLRAEAAGFPAPATLVTEVPSPSGGYDLRF